MVSYSPNESRSSPCEASRRGAQTTSAFSGHSVHTRAQHPRNATSTMSAVPETSCGECQSRATSHTVPHRHGHDQRQPRRHRHRHRTAKEPSHQPNYSPGMSAAAPGPTAPPVQVYHTLPHPPLAYPTHLYPHFPTSLAFGISRPHALAPASVLQNFGAGPAPLFGWESVIPLDHKYGSPKYFRRVKPDYRRFCVSVGKAEVPIGVMLARSQGVHFV
jgi:hypothetical protein